MNGFPWRSSFSIYLEPCHGYTVNLFEHYSGYTQVYADDLESLLRGNFWRSFLDMVEGYAGPTKEQQ